MTCLTRCGIFLDAQFALDHAAGERHLWLDSAPIMYGNVAIA
jgi:hypothetical protein